MELNLTKKTFLVFGCSAGFGRAVAEALMKEGARVIGVARTEPRLKELKDEYGDLFFDENADVKQENQLQDVLLDAQARDISGVFINSGGPPAGGFFDPEPDAWDEAYNIVMKWKITVLRDLVPYLQKRGYGRVVLLESQSVKQPIPNLVLSNAFRAGVAGAAKTLASEVARDGVTINILAPGSHDAPAIHRVIEKKASALGISAEEARKQMEASIPVQRFGKPEELASLALWLLSEHSGFVTGQVISHAGGNIAGLFG